MIKKVIFVLILLFLPTQLGRHYWFDFSYVLGQRIDYLSPTIYLTDIFIAILFLLELKAFFRFFKAHFLPVLLSSCLVVLLSLFWIHFQNQLPGLLLYKWIKLFEFLFLVFWIKRNVRIKQVLFPLSLGVLGESLLAWLEFFNQRSLDFWILGERTFDTATPGIALSNWQGRLMLRPSATFSHPNVLAGYILIILILSLFLKWQPNFLRICTLIFGTITIGICFSRVVWFTWLSIICLWLWRKKKNAFAK